MFHYSRNTCTTYKHTTYKFCDRADDLKCSYKYFCNQNFSCEIGDNLVFMLVTNISHRKFSCKLDTKRLQAGRNVITNSKKPAKNYIYFFFIIPCYALKIN